MVNSVLVCALLLAAEGLCSSSRSEEKCREYAEKYKSDRLVVSHLKGPASSLGKVPTAPGEFPHMAALGFLKENGKDLDWLCGGSLISDRYVLTSAVCTKGPYGPVQKVRLGDHNLHSATDDNALQQFNITSITTHPDLSPPALYNSLALLELSRPARFTGHVRPACLYAPADVDPELPISATGWGKINFGGGPSDALVKVYLDHFTDEECKRLYGDLPDRKLPRGVDGKLMFCAGGRTEAKDTCKGDAGGPLQVLDVEENVYRVAGITSFGRACGKIGYASLYTRVSPYIPWIERVVWG